MRVDNAVPKYSSVKTRNLRHSAWRPERRFTGETPSLSEFSLRRGKGSRESKPLKSLSTVLIISGLASFMTGVFLLNRQNGELSTSQTGTYIVQPGDTLWSISTKTDSRDYVWVVESWIEQQNHLDDGQVQPGDKLIVPIGRN